VAFRDYFTPSATAEQNLLVVQALNTVIPEAQSALTLSLKVPVYFKDLSAYNGLVAEDHFHAHDASGAHGHGLGYAGAAAGLFWWNYTGEDTVTRAWIEVDPRYGPEFSKEVMLAEAAHAFDMLCQQWDRTKRGKLYDAYHGYPLGTTGPISWQYKGSTSHPHGWFGPQGYYDTPGESFMATFIKSLTTTAFSGETRWSHGSPPALLDVFKSLVGLGEPPTPPPPPPTGNLALDNFLRELRAATFFKSWASANPGELTRFNSFVAGGTRPVMVTPFGRALIHAVGKFVGR
jgi:hypothetical protein